MYIDPDRFRLWQKWFFIVVYGLVCLIFWYITIATYFTSENREEFWVFLFVTSVITLAGIFVYIVQLSKIGK